MWRRKPDAASFALFRVAPRPAIAATKLLRNSFDYTYWDVSNQLISGPTAKIEGNIGTITKDLGQLPELRGTGGIWHVRHQYTDQPLSIECYFHRSAECFWLSRPCFPRASSRVGRWAPGRSDGPGSTCRQPSQGRRRRENIATIAHCVSRSSAARSAAGSTSIIVRLQAARCRHAAAPTRQRLHQPRRIAKPPRSLQVPPLPCRTRRRRSGRDEGRPGQGGKAATPSTAAFPQPPLDRARRRQVRLERQDAASAQAVPPPDWRFLLAIRQERNVRAEEVVMISLQHPAFEQESLRLMCRRPKQTPSLKDA